MNNKIKNLIKKVASPSNGKEEIENKQKKYKKIIYYIDIQAKVATKKYENFN